jgi:autotransporter-associated beta strand protein
MFGQGAGGVGLGTIYVGPAAQEFNNPSSTINIGSPIVLAAGANPVFNINQASAGVLTLSGVVSGSGGISKDGTLNPLVLSANNTYSGNTTIKAGILTVLATGSISNSAVIDVQTGATFNVSSNANFKLQTAQTLKGNGTIWGNVTTDGTISPGASIGTLTFANNLTVAGNLYIEVDRSGPTSDLITVLGTANNAGVGAVQVANVGAALQVGDSFQIFSAGVANGQALTVVGGGVVWNNTINSDGKITVAAIATPATDMHIVMNSPTSFTMGALGAANKPYGVYMAPTVTTPMANWTLIGTATANGSGVIQFTDTQATSQQRYYRFGQ